jgi:hypothetical protein
VSIAQLPLDKLLAKHSFADCKMGANESSLQAIPNWNPNGRVLLYVDNSNIYWSTLAHAGKKQGFPAKPNQVPDVSCRMSLHTLIDGAVKGRNVIVKNAYGVMIPEVSTVFSNLK